MNGYNLSPYQQRIWALQQQGVTMEHQLQLALAGPFRPQQLEQAVAAVVERHEMLRASFVQVPGLLYPLQVINEAHSGALWYKAATLPVNHDEIRITHPCDWSRTCLLDRNARRAAIVGGGRY